MKLRGKINKNKKILGVFIIFILIGVVFIKTRDNMEWVYYYGETNIESVVFSKISSENPDDISYVIDENIRHSGNYLLGHYIVDLSLSGRRSVEQGTAIDSFIFEYDRAIYRVYDLITKELVSEFDVLEILENFGEVMENYGLTDFGSGIRINDQLYIYATLNRRLEGNRILFREGFYRLLINVETGESRIEEWDIEVDFRARNSHAFDNEISFFGANGRWTAQGELLGQTAERAHRSFLENNGIYDEGISGFLITTSRLQPDTVRIVISSKNLPEENNRLYTLFPGLNQFRNQEGMRIYIILTGGHWTAEELLSLFMEDGQEISFEGVVMSGDVSIDGEKHEIHSFEDYFRLRDFGERDEE